MLQCIVPMHINTYKFNFNFKANVNKDRLYSYSESFMEIEY